MSSLSILEFVHVKVSRTQFQHFVSFFKGPTELEKCAIVPCQAFKLIIVRTTILDD